MNVFVDCFWKGVDLCAVVETYYTDRSYCYLGYLHYNRTVEQI